jgi:L-aspartate oxidase
MLECLVFGRRAAEDINRAAPAERGALPQLYEYAVASLTLQRSFILPFLAREREALDYAAIRNNIRTLMSKYGYIIRTTRGLSYALDSILAILSALERVYDDGDAYLETLNIATVAKAILEAALKRPKSIGSHYIED